MDRESTTAGQFRRMTPDDPVTSTSVQAGNETSVTTTIDTIAPNGSQSWVGEVVGTLQTTSVLLVSILGFVVAVVFFVSLAKRYRRRIVERVGSPDRCVHCEYDLGAVEDRTDGRVETCPRCGDDPYHVLPFLLDGVVVVPPPSRCAHCWYDLSQVPYAVDSDDYCPHCGNEPDSLLAVLRTTGCAECGNDIERYQRDTGGPISRCPHCGEPPY